jgi:hypothetical protein
MAAARLVNDYPVRLVRCTNLFRFVTVDSRKLFEEFANIKLARVLPIYSAMRHHSLRQPSTCIIVSP